MRIWQFYGRCDGGVRRHALKHVTSARSSHVPGKMKIAGSPCEVWWSAVCCRVEPRVGRVYMISGNGVDIGAVYQLLTEVAQAVAGHDRKLDAQDRKLDDIVDRLDGHDRKLDAQDRKLNEVILVVNRHTAKLDELASVVNAHDRKLDDLAADVGGLRETLTHYHSSVLGHGLLYSELEDRVRRIERLLKIEPAG